MSSDKLTLKQKEALAVAVQAMTDLFDDKQLAVHLAERVRVFRGNFDHLEAALGALLIGRLVGWEALRIIHSNATFRRYESILGLSFQGATFPWSGELVMEKRGIYAGKSTALKVVDTVGDFWQVFQGRSDITRSQRKAFG